MIDKIFAIIVSILIIVISFFIRDEKTGGNEVTEKIKQINSFIEGKELDLYTNMSQLQNFEYAEMKVLYDLQRFSCMNYNRSVFLMLLQLAELSPESDIIIVLGMENVDIFDKVLDVYPDKKILLVSHIKYSKDEKYEYIDYKSCDVFDYIRKSNNKVFVLLEFITKELCETLSKYNVGNVCLHTKQLRVYKIKSMVSDVEHLWNHTLISMFLMSILPNRSTVVDRPPFYNGSYTDEMVDPIQDDLDYLNNKLGVDILGNYRKGEYWNFDASNIWLIPWNFPGSSSALLHIKKEDLRKKWVSWELDDWNDKSFYLRMIKGYGFFPKFYIHLNLPKCYDGCHDCGLELLILINHGSGGFNENIDPLDVLKNSDKLKKFYNICEKVDNLLGDYKIDNCLYHGYLTKPLLYTNHYYFRNDRMYKVTAHKGNITKKENYPLGEICEVKMAENTDKTYKINCDSLIKKSYY
jgi:hypothetical protein